MNLVRELENLIIISINKARLLIRNLEQHMFTMNNKTQSREVFYKKAVLKNFSVFTGKYLFSSLSLMKLRAFRSATLLKQIPTQVFLCECCKIFKNAFFEENL